MTFQLQKKLQTTQEIIKIQDRYKNVSVLFFTITTKKTYNIIILHNVLFGTFINALAERNNEMKKMSLNDIKPGEHAIVSKIQTTGSMRRRFLDIGLVENTDVECLGRSPSGDPSSYLIRGAVIAIRSEDSRDILVKNCQRRS